MGSPESDRPIFYLVLCLSFRTANKDVNRWNTFPARLLPARLLPASILRLVLLRTGLGGSGGSDRRAAAADLIFSRHLQRRPSCGPVFGEAGKGGALMFSRLRRRPSCGPDFGEAGGDRRGCKAAGVGTSSERLRFTRDGCAVAVGVASEVSDGKTRGAGLWQRARGSDGDLGDSGPRGLGKGPGAAGAPPLLPDAAAGAAGASPNCFQRSFVPLGFQMRYAWHASST